MIETFNILTCKAKSNGHQQTVLSINWEGLTQEQLMVLARSCIVHALQTRWKKDQFLSIPAEHKVNASEFVKGELHEVLIDRPQVNAKREAVDWMDKLLAGMSPEERKRLLVDSLEEL